jgi:hypothetical protein
MKPRRPKIQVNKRAMWYGVFDEVVEQYQNIKSMLGTISGMNYEKALQGTEGSGGVNLVRPMLIDFVADVELKAQRALKSNPDQLEHWKMYYASLNHVSVLNTELNDKVKMKVGRMLLAKEIYPTVRYFKGRYVERRHSNDAN